MLTATKPMGIRMLAAAFAGALALVAGLAFAQPARAEDYRVWVQDVQITSDNAGDVLGDGTVSYDVDRNMLTLDGAEIMYDDADNMDYARAIFADGVDLTIRLEGENTILPETTRGIYNSHMRAIESEDASALTIEGPGSLTMEAYEPGNGAFFYYGIVPNTAELAITKGATVSINIDNDHRASSDTLIGITTNGDKSVRVDGANLRISVTGGQNTTAIGIASAGGVFTNGAQVVSTVDDGGSSSLGIYCGDKLTIDGGSFVYSNFFASSSGNAAILSHGDITVGGGCGVIGNCYNGVIHTDRGAMKFEKGAQFRGTSPRGNIIDPLPQFAEGTTAYVSTEPNGNNGELVDASQITADHRFVAIPSKTMLMRIAGEYANETAALIAADFPMGETGAVVLARDDDFADALGATGLAGALRAPILLTDRTELSPAAAERITSLAAKKVYIIGGTGAISAQLEADLEEQCGITDVVRVFGENSYDTSLECAKAIEEVTGEEASTAIIAMSLNFQDALSMSGIAYMQKAPVILQTWGDTSAGRGFTDEAKAYLAGKSLVVAGGPGAISEESLTGFTVRDRIYGETGYDTSAEIAKWGLENHFFDTTGVILACGAQAPKGTDALAGSAVSGFAGFPILLINANDAMEPVNTVATDTLLGEGGLYEDVQNIYVLGGTYVMPQEYVDSLNAFEMPYIY